MGEMTKPGDGTAATAPILREIHPSELIGRIGTPMFCLDVLSLEPLDVVFSGFNDAQGACTGIRPAEVLGRRPEEILPRRGAANVMDNYRRCLEQGGPIEYEEGYESFEGQKWYHTTLSPWRDRAGRIMAIVGSAVEVTEQRLRADEDAATIGRLRRLSDEVRTFASMAAHDVRSPLATLESLADLIAAEIEGGDTTSALTLLAEGATMAREARGQMDALLRHANALGAGRSPPSRTDLGRMGRDVSAVIDPQGRIAIRWPQDLVTTDAVTLQLILRNLMANAVRHCRGAVAVSFAPEAGSDGFAAFEVCDDGPGFSRDPFAGDDVLGRHETASGFGLAAARYLVESRGGEIGVVPEASGGAVRFTVPCRLADA